MFPASSLNAPGANRGLFFRFVLTQPGRICDPRFRELGRPANHRHSQNDEKGSADTRKG